MSEQVHRRPVPEQGPDRGAGAEPELGPGQPAVVDDDAAKRDISQLVADQSFAEAAPKTRKDQHAFWRGVVFLLALALSLFHLYTAIFGTLPSLQQRTFHVAFGLGLIFLIYPASRPQGPRQLWTGWALTGLGLFLLAYLYVTGQAYPYILIPAAVVLVVVQAARHLPLRLWGMPLADILLSLLGFAAGLYLFFDVDTLLRSAGRVPTVDASVTPFFWAGTVGILLVLVAAQRAIGSALTILAAIMLVYAYVGPYLPGFLAHGGYSVDRIVASSFLGSEGVFGTPIAVSATFIFLFMIFAAMLQRTGMEKFFTRLALGLAGGYTGGTAKVGVLTSAFSGTITGSSVANTVSNGAFTIPMMRRSGFKRDFAGAVEAASSTGGQFAPPIMGAAAFIMIEMTGIPYIEIIKAAAIPAVLFFVAQFIVIHFEAKKQGIRGLPREQLPSVRRLLAIQGYLLAPIILIFVILASGFTPMRAALWAIGATIVINIVVQLGALVVGAARRDPPPLEPGAADLASAPSREEPAPPAVEPASGAGLRRVVRRLRLVAGQIWWRGRLWSHRLRRRGYEWQRRQRLRWRRWLADAPPWVRGAVAQWRNVDDKLTPGRLLEGLVDAARIALPIIAACAAAGLIAGVITLTGLGLKLVGELTSLAGEIAGVLNVVGGWLNLPEVGVTGLLIITMFLVMISCLILGIGVPTTANYVITATLAAPVLIAFDAVPLLAAHMFVYYFGVMADITPPVCLAAYAASGISGGNPLRTGVWSFRIAISGFIVPYMFVLNPQLLLLDVTWSGAIAVVATALVGVTALGAAVAGYLDRPLHWGTRILLLVASLSLLGGGLASDAFGFALFVAVFGYHYWTGRDRPAPDRVG
ncbi:TRAP transporter permease [Natronosporangium hydrolyticum]|uniref:TRAP transporter permease n=1 Tax=Natronosporangium hydrolyticum TaxID=2811111 RepID=A0A895YLU9_9ACTN|nr:TRAP transporter permease [Natronosporangium hydrolyticum]QSB15656.1 TRAP transporter permease [Natronosporangium hydrolyticum]